MTQSGVMPSFILGYLFLFIGFILSVLNQIIIKQVDRNIKDINHIINNNKIEKGNLTTKNTIIDDVIIDKINLKKYLDKYMFIYVKKITTITYYERRMRRMNTYDDILEYEYVNDPNMTIYFNDKLYNLVNKDSLKHLARYNKVETIINNDENMVKYEIYGIPNNMIVYNTSILNNKLKDIYDFEPAEINIKDFMLTKRTNIYKYCINIVQIVSFILLFFGIYLVLSQLKLLYPIMTRFSKFLQILINLAHMNVILSTFIIVFSYFVIIKILFKTW